MTDIDMNENNGKLSININSKLISEECHVQNFEVRKYVSLWNIKGDKVDKINNYSNRCKFWIKI